MFFFDEAHCVVWLLETGWLCWLVEVSVVCSPGWRAGRFAGCGRTLSVGAEVLGGLFNCRRFGALVVVVSYLGGVVCAGGWSVLYGGKQLGLWSSDGFCGLCKPVRGSDGERPRPHRGRGAQYLSSPLGERQADVLAHSQ